MKPHIAKLAASMPARRLKGADGTDYNESMTCIARLQWPALAEPKAYKANKPKYSAVLIFPGNADLGPIREIIANVAKAKWQDKAIGMLKSGALNSPLRPQSEKEHHGDSVGFGSEGFFATVSANVEYPPTVFDGAKNKLTGEAAASALYAGCWVVAKVNAYTYDNNGNKGVSLGLRAIQKVADDDKLSTGGGAENGDDFAPVAGGVAPMTGAETGAGASDVW